MSSVTRNNGIAHEQRSAGESSSRKRYHLRPSSSQVRSKIAELAAFEEDGWCHECFKGKGKHRKYAHLRKDRECATARERGRMHSLNDAFDKLRGVIPNTICSSEQKLSKIATLRQAIYYISMLANVLDCDEGSDKSSEESEAEPEPMTKRSRVESGSDIDRTAENSSGTENDSSQQTSSNDLFFGEGSFGVPSFWCDLEAVDCAPSPGDIPFHDEFQYHL